MSSPVEEIKKRLDIVDLIGSYIRLAKAGANFKAVCPFHNEKSPSFYISPAREIWHCFGCNAGGDIFRFVQMIEGIEFPEALEVLASRAGVVLRREDPKLSSERRRILSVVEESVKYFQNELSKNEEANKYLKDRGIKQMTIDDFKLGFAPDGWGNLLTHLLQKGFTNEEVLKAGLTISSSNPSAKSKYYDRFRSRIMFPIADASGRTVGFSGRIFSAKGGSVSGGKKEEAKYINTPNTILYDKSKVLYLWDRAKNDVRKENACIVVEGQMDALMSHQAGFINTIATSGTALGGGHLFLIKRLTPNLLLAFDNDEAGELASRRAYELALESGFEASVIEVPKGKDPAEAILENKEIWLNAIKSAKPVIAFFLNNLMKKYSGDLHKMRSEARSSVLPIIAKFSNEMEKAHWVQETSKILQLKEEPLWDEVKKLPSGMKSEDYQKGEEKLEEEVRKTRKHMMEERMLGLLKWKPELVSILPGNIKSLFSIQNVSMLDSLLAGEDKFSQELTKFSLEAELLSTQDSNSEDDLKNLLAELERETIKTKLELISEEIRKTEVSGERAKLAEYLNEFQDASKRLNILWQEAKLKK